VTPINIGTKGGKVHWKDSGKFLDWRHVRSSLSSEVCEVPKGIVEGVVEMGLETSYSSALNLHLLEKGKGSTYKIRLAKETTSSQAKLSHPSSLWGGGGGS